MKFRFCLAAATLALAEESKNDKHSYEVPATEGLHWVETFDGDALSRWIPSEQEKYTVKPTIGKRRKEGLIGDVGLIMPNAAQHYGISTSFPELAAGRKGETFVLQYEARFQDGLHCGGGYVKLFNRGGRDPKDFDNEVPYIIMFGPDRCGTTDKVHFILQHQNPKTKKWEEKHFKEPPSVPRDENTHLYSLVIRPDSSFDILVDGQSKAAGNLLESLDPPINPPKQIDDPSDSKPADWIDDPKMPDPEAFKPDDWDEDEPRMIADPDAKMPDGWLEAEEKRISDPSAKMPSDWDEDEDGEWEAPMIDNPACTIGCGEWSPPKISNAKYKGKWSAPMIDNPNYIGVWKPQQIDNPDFFVDEDPSVLPQIDSLGVDIWTMQGNIIFDNFLISTDEQKAKDFTMQTFDIRKIIEDEQNPSASAGPMSMIVDTIQNNPIPVAITVVLLIAGAFWMACRGDAAPLPGPASVTKPTSEPKISEASDSAKETDAGEKRKDTKEERQKEDKPKEEAAGGVGLDEKDE
jgi:calnexin